MIMFCFLVDTNEMAKVIAVSPLDRYLEMK
mgnify:CR=1 FL=1